MGKERCPACKGRGEVTGWLHALGDVHPSSHTCGWCKGTGKAPEGKKWRTKEEAEALWAEWEERRKGGKSEA